MLPIPVRRTSIRRPRERGAPHLVSAACSAVRSRTTFPLRISVTGAGAALSIRGSTRLRPCHRRPYELSARGRPPVRLRIRRSHRDRPERRPRRIVPDPRPRLPSRVVSLRHLPLTSGGGPSETLRFLAPLPPVHVPDAVTRGESRQAEIACGALWIMWISWSGAARSVCRILNRSLFQVHATASIRDTLRLRHRIYPRGVSHAHLDA